ncbi:MAG: serine/threonine-protein phosphatase [Planctomycetota bacterium]|nr:MAG: serine/threonine-protein phosphatase [Planctomycetota bacterium]
MRRAINQDAHAEVLAESQAQWESRGHLFIVADGMGAHVAGELASKIAVQQVPLHYAKLRDLPPAEALFRAINEANAEIHRRGQANIEFRNMGTTCSALVLLPEGAVIGHVGDSRVYQLRGNRFHQLTFDHSLVWEMQAAGEVTDETARSGAIPKNVITRSLGPNPTVQVDLEGPFPIRVGDRFLVCSDGLSGQISDEELGALLRCLSPQEAARILVDLSNLRGGPDNITAIIVEVVDPRLETKSHMAIAPIGAEHSPPKFSPLLAGATALCWLAALLLLLAGLKPLAAVAAILGLVAAIIGVVQWIGGSGPQQRIARYGKGPYRKYRAEPDRPLFEHLANTMKSLREAAEERGWQIDWGPLEEAFGEARAAADRGDFSTAVALQAKVVSTLMEQIRKQRGSESSQDSSIDL